VSWPTVALREVADIERNSVKPENIASGTRYLGLEHVESGGRIISSETVANGELASSKFSFGPRHILYGKLRPYLAKIALPEFNGVCSTDILPVLPSERIERNYLAHFLRQSSMVDYANSLSTGANLPRLSPKALAEFPIPLPPLEEQKRIAGILDQADALRRLRTRALDKLNTLGQAIFHEMFGEALRGDFLAFGHVVEEFRYGTSNKSGDGGVPTLRIPNVIGGGIDTQEIKTVEVTVAELERLRLRDGDVLFVRTNGNPDYVGRCAAFREADVAEYDTQNDWIFASYLIRARLSEQVNPIFAKTYFASRLGRMAVRERSKTSAGQFNINTEGLSSLPFPKVPKVDQDRFSDALSAIENYGAPMKRSAEKLDANFASLQYSAFRGEL